MPIRKCPWCGSKDYHRCRGGYQCAECEMMFPLPNRSGAGKQSIGTRRFREGMPEYETDLRYNEII